MFSPEEDEVAGIFTTQPWCFFVGRQVVQNSGNGFEGRLEAAEEELDKDGLEHIPENDSERQRENGGHCQIHEHRIQFMSAQHPPTEARNLTVRLAFAVRGCYGLQRFLASHLRANSHFVHKGARSGACSHKPAAQMRVLSLGKK